MALYVHLGIGSTYRSCTDLSGFHPLPKLGRFISKFSKYTNKWHFLYDYLPVRLSMPLSWKKLQGRMSLAATKGYTKNKDCRELDIPL